MERGLPCSLGRYRAKSSKVGNGKIGRNLSSPIDGCCNISASISDARHLILNQSICLAKITWIKRARSRLPTLSLLKRTLLHIESNLGSFECNLCSALHFCTSFAYPDYFGQSLYQIHAQPSHMRKRSRRALRLTCR